MPLSRVPQVSFGDTRRIIYDDIVCDDDELLFASSPTARAAATPIPWIPQYLALYVALQIIDYFMYMCVLSILRASGCRRTPPSMSMNSWIEYMHEDDKCIIYTYTAPGFELEQIVAIPRTRLTSAQQLSRCDVLYNELTGEVSPLSFDQYCALCDSDDDDPYADMLELYGIHD